MKKKILAIGLVFLAIVFLCVCLGEVSKFEEEVAQREALLNCDITPGIIQIIGFGPLMLPPYPPGPSYVDFAIPFSIYNPNSITATLDRIDYTIYINDIPIGTGSLSKRIDILPMKTEMITTRYRADMTTVPAVIVSNIQTGELTLGVEGMVYIDTPLGELIIPFS